MNKVYYNTISSKDTKCRAYSKELRKRLENSTTAIGLTLDYIDSRLEKIEQNQVFRQEPNVEIIKEIHYKTDKKMFIVLSITLIINLCLTLLLK